MATAQVQPNLTLAQLGRCYARIARKIGVREVNPRALQREDVRYKKGTAVYVLDVGSYGLLACMPARPPAPGNISLQTNPDFLRAAHKALQQWVTDNQVAWPSGCSAARRDYGLDHWPPSPKEISVERRQRRAAREIVSTEVESPAPVEQPRPELPVAHASEETPPPEEVPQQAVSPDKSDDLGCGPIITATDLAEGNYVRDGDLFIPHAA